MLDERGGVVSIHVPSPLSGLPRPEDNDSSGVRSEFSLTVNVMRSNRFVVGPLIKILRNIIIAGDYATVKLARSHPGCRDQGLTKPQYSSWAVRQACPNGLDQVAPTIVVPAPLLDMSRIADPT